MRYIKTNEGLLTFKSEAKFDKILNELKSFLSEEGYIITRIIYFNIKHNTL